MANTNTLSRFWQLPLGIQLAAAALVVAVPRYVIAFLAADNLRFPSLVEGALLGVSAIATAIIVAGGGAYTAHVVSSASGQAGKRALLLALWLVLLACEIVLLAPPVVASLRKSELAHVLLAQFYFDALWSVVMVATPALCAAACVLAASLDKRTETQTETLKTSNPTLTPQDEPQATVITPPTISLDDLDRAIMAAYTANPTASKSAVAKLAGTTRQTVDNRVNKMQAAGLAHVNGAVYFNGNGGTH